MNIIRNLFLLSTILAGVVAPGHALETYKVLYRFHGTTASGNDGALPFGELIADSSGNLYGTTLDGGRENRGTVFKLTKEVGGRWSEKVLHSFSGATDGDEPRTGLVMDAAGNLYGTAGGGDPNCASKLCGVIFELTPGATGVWSATVIHTFLAGGNDGYQPSSALTIGADGNLYGTTSGGGDFGLGTVFKLSRNGSQWMETILHSFNQREGNGPNSKLIFDETGNLWATTANGGDSECSLGCGTVFELLPQPDGSWLNRTVHAFDITDGDLPAGLSLDANGNFFGVAQEGALGNCLEGNQKTEGCGLAFEISPSGTGFQNRIIHNYNLTTQRANRLLVDPSGVLYGTTVWGGLQCPFSIGTCGSIYKLTPDGAGYSFSMLYKFHAQGDGANPWGLTRDNEGNIYGVTVYGGDTECFFSGGCGVVFQILP